MMRYKRILPILTLTSGSLISPAYAQVWFEPLPFTLPGAADFSGLGASSGMFGDRVYFGAPGTNTLGTDAGAVYGFEMDAPMSMPLPLSHPDIDSGDRFGAGLAVRDWSYGDGNPLSVIVGAPSDEGPNGEQGRVYFFDFNTDFMYTLTAPNGQAGDAFGSALGVFEDAVVVGSPAVPDGNGYPKGEAHYYTQTPDDLTHGMVLEPQNTFDFSFGASVSSNRFRFLIGAPGIPDGDPKPNPITTRGAAYLYYPSGQQIARLIAPVRNNGARFGASIAQGERFEFVIGAPGDSVASDDSGAAYFWDQGDGEGNPATLAPSELDPDDRFGHALAINDNLIFVGAPGDDDAGQNAGAVYLFSIETQQLIQKITPEGLSGDLSEMRFGSSISVFDFDRIAVGAEGFDGVGQTYLLENTCPIDFDYNGVLDFFDVSGFIVIEPDLNMDGQFNFFDVSLFLELYNSSCN